MKSFKQNGSDLHHPSMIGTYMIATARNEFLNLNATLITLPNPRNKGASQIVTLVVRAKILTMRQLEILRRSRLTSILIFFFF